MLRLLYGYSPSKELDALSAAAQQLASDAAKMLSASSRILDIVPIRMYHAGKKYYYIYFTQFWNF